MVSIKVGRAMVISLVVIVVVAVLVGIIAAFTVPKEQPSVPPTPTVTVPIDVPTSVSLWPENSSAFLSPHVERPQFHPHFKIPKHLRHKVPKFRKISPS